MSLTDTLNTMVATVTGKALNRYRLDIPSCTADIDVEDFSGSEAMSELYSYTINFTSADKNIDARQMLSKPATLTMGAGNLLSLTERKVVHGVVTHFERTGGSADEAKYCIVLEPFLALLGNQFRTHRFFVNKSVPEVVTEVLTEHGLKGWEYEFTLKADYPKREQINQYQENDLAFIERLLAEVGIFYFFTLQPDTQTEVVHFADKQSAWTFGKTLPLNSPSGANDNAVDSVWGVHVWHNVVERSVTASDYNHREAQNVLMSVPADMTRGDWEGNTYGDVYHYRPRHLERGDKITPTAETGNFLARLEHERFLSTQTTVTGSATDHTLGPAQVLKITETAIPPTLPRETENGLVIISAGYSASRQNALKVEWAAMPYYENRCWRPAAKKRPVVSGSLTARVTSAKDNDIYAWQDASGMYRVKFDADRDDKRQGIESMPVRFAKPYGGDKYGFHFPLIQGTEVAIAFHEGDPDRPYIAHAMHDSRHVDHVTEANSTRNVIRTAGLNKLRMEDKRGEEHVKLSTEYGGKTQLNLGHNVNASRALRGEGAELRTNDWVSIRGGKGVLLTADAQPDVGSKMLEMDRAVEQLEQALTLARSLQAAAKGAQATVSDIDSQKTLNSSLKYLKMPGMLASAPAGIGILSPETIRLASGGASIGLMSGKNTDISTGQSFTVAAGEAVSLFAQAAGMKMYAGAGKVDIHAQSDAMSVSALQDITVASGQGGVKVNASKELILSCGGAYIKLSGGNIEMGCPGNILLKATNVNQTGPASLDTPPVTFPKGYSGKFTIRDGKSGEIKPLTNYRVTSPDGEVFDGISDSEGKTSTLYSAMPGKMGIEFPDEIDLEENTGNGDEEAAKNNVPDNATPELRYAVDEKNKIRFKLYRSDGRSYDTLLTRFPQGFSAWAPLELPQLRDFLEIFTSSSSSWNLNGMPEHLKNQIASWGMKPKLRDLSTYIKWTKNKSTTMWVSTATNTQAGGQSSGDPLYEISLDLYEFHIENRTLVPLENGRKSDLTPSLLFNSVSPEQATIIALNHGRIDDAEVSFLTAIPMDYIKPFK